MDERGNKTIMCSVLFLDIIEYSRKPVAVQILLKERFNGYLAAAIREVPVVDRIIVDAGAGVAVNFLGDAGDALRTALNLRESLLNENPNTESRLQVCMGINLGPVRLILTDSGQPGIVGDGISVAQRVMGFADANQILVSRSYYDAVLRLLPQHADWFRYQGSRTDKHIREHELFAVGYPEDQPPRPGATERMPAGPVARPHGVFARARAVWQTGAQRLDTMVARSSARLQHAGVGQRTVSVGVVMIPLLLLAMLMLKLIGHFIAPAVPTGTDNISVVPASGRQPVLALRVSPELNTAPASASGVAAAAVAANQPVSSSPVGEELRRELSAQPKGDGREARIPSSESAKQKVPEDSSEGQGFSLKAVVKFINKHLPAKQTAVAQNATEATVVVNCTDGATVLVDGQKIGVISSGSLTFALSPGKHLIGIHEMTRGSIYSQENLFEGGKTMTIKPSLCL